jgi:WD40 repeat protein
VIWDASGKQLRVLEPDADTEVLAIAFCADGKTLAVRYKGGPLRLWDLQTGNKWEDIPFDKIGNGRGVRFSPDGVILATECDDLKPARIRMWNVSARPRGGAQTSPVAASLPQALGDQAVSRDDLLAQEIDSGIHRMFDAYVTELKVEVLPDGAARLSGTVTNKNVKVGAERIAANQHTHNEPALTVPRRVVNDLEISARAGNPPTKP